MLSVLGLAPLPLVIYYGINDGWFRFMAGFLAAWGVLLFMTVIMSFRYMEAQFGKQPGWLE
jgi:hypothetical protein